MGSSAIMTSSGCGGGAPPPRAASPLERLQAAALDLDLARLRALQHGDADRQDTVHVGGVDLVTVEVLGQVDAAGEGAHRPLLEEEALVVAVLVRAPGGDAEHAAVDGHLDGAGVHARQVEPEDHVGGTANAVHRHDRRARGEGLTGEPVELPLDLLQERVDRRQEHRLNLLTDSLLTSNCTYRLHDSRTEGKL